MFHMLKFKIDPDLSTYETNLILGRGGGPGGPDRRSMERNSMGGAGENSNFRGPRGNFDRVMDKLNQIQGPTLDIPQLDMTEKKFRHVTHVQLKFG